MSVFKSRHINEGELNRIIELAKLPARYRPLEIRNLEETIKSETRLAEQHLTIHGTVNMVHLNKIIQMKLRLDGLYEDWALGKITS